MIFNSAYAAVMGVITPLDMDDLEQKIQNLIGKGNRVLIVTDGIFSMRGEHAPLAKVSDIA